MAPLASPKRHEAAQVHDRFAIALEGVGTDTTSNHWRDLCHVDGSPPTEAFKNVYTHFTTSEAASSTSAAGTGKGSDVTWSRCSRRCPKVRARLAIEPTPPQRLMPARRYRSNQRRVNGSA